MTKLDTCNQTNKRDYRKFSKKKHFSEHLAFQLHYQNPQSTLTKSYRNTIYCAKTLIPNEEKETLTSKYCKNRWCPLCQSIRVATLINRYSLPLSKMTDPQFVTLTAPTVTEEELRQRIKDFGVTWRNIALDRYWKKNKPNGIRKAECTLRPNGHYHYHFHIIIDGKENAEWLVIQWLKRIAGAEIQAQDIRPVRKGEYIEIFKYFTKLLAKDKSGNRYIDFVRLNTILEALAGKRVYQPFGNIKQVSEDMEDYELVARLDKNDKMRIWNWATNIGYVCEDDGQILADDYELPKWVEQLCVNPKNESNE